MQTRAWVVLCKRKTRLQLWKVSPHFKFRNRGLQGFTPLSIPQSQLIEVSRNYGFSLPISQSVTVTADRSFTRSSSFAAHRKGNKATCPPGCNVASSARHKNSQVPPLMSLIVNLLVDSSQCPLVHSSSHRIVCTTVQ